MPLLLLLAACSSFTLHVKDGLDDEPIGDTGDPGNPPPSDDTGPTDPPAPDEDGTWHEIDCEPNFAIPTAFWTAYPSLGGPRPVEIVNYFTSDIWLRADIIVWDTTTPPPFILITAAGTNAIDCAAWEWMPPAP